MRCPHSSMMLTDSSAYRHPEAVLSASMAALLDCKLARVVLGFTPQETKVDS